MRGGESKTSTLHGLTTKSVHATCFDRDGLTSNHTEGNILDPEEGQNEIAKAISNATISI
jgi:hypothetical protein